MELIVASVYNAQLLGITLAIIGIITSGLYLHFNLRSIRKDNFEEEVNRQITEDKEANSDNKEELNSSFSDKGGLSKTTKMIMQA